MTNHRVVFTTAPTKKEARKLARTLTDRRLAACISIVPGVESIFRWKGKVESAQEWLLVIKTSQKRFAAVRDAIKATSSYDLPECISVKIDGGGNEYLKWLANEVR